MYIKGRDAAVQMMDMMMADEEFMREQEMALAEMDDIDFDDLDSMDRKQPSTPRSARAKPDLLISLFVSELVNTLQMRTRKTLGPVTLKSSRIA